jgi:HEAT repeat protein
MLQALAELLKRGLVGRLEVINLDVHPDAGLGPGVRSVPWVRIGPFEFSGARSLGELESWARRAGSAEGMADYFHVQLKEGGLSRVQAMVDAQPDRLGDLLPIVANADASMNVRLGASAVFERRAGSVELRALLPQLGQLAAHPDARVRADACHFLGLAAMAEGRDYLLPRLQDESADVREIAADSLAVLGATSKTFHEEEQP